LPEEGKDICDRHHVLELLGARKEKGHQGWPKFARAAANDAAHNPTPGSQSASLIDVKNAQVQLA
jgi:hypothetical protein